MTEPCSLRSLLERVKGVTCIDDSTDRVNSIVNSVVRCVYKGRRAVAVCANTKTAVDGLLDLVDLHLTRTADLCDSDVVSDEVVFLLVSDEWDTEAEGALRTVASQLLAPFRVQLRRVNSRCEVLPISAHGLDDIGDHEKYRYTEWLRYLMDTTERPSALVDRLLDDVAREELRAYPMLTKKGWWSLRIEGLELAQIGPRHGRIDVGRDYEGRRGPERTTWLSTCPEGLLQVSEDDASIARAVEAINSFADAWNAVVSSHDKQHEHTLESRILRGVVPVHASTGQLETVGGADAGRVSRGSQFPTRWGRTDSNAGRYLDALLRNGSTPWALEIKIEGASGVGGYYRHAVAQAVLYRHFIRQAEYLAPWFEGFGLDHAACRAAVVVPEFRADPVPWRDRLQRVCDVFDVELITVPEHFARRASLE